MPGYYKPIKMGRRGLTLRPTAAPGSSRPRPILDIINDPNTRVTDLLNSDTPFFRVSDLGDGVCILLPYSWLCYPPNWVYDGDIDAPDADWRRHSEMPDYDECWKTVVAYEKIGQPHPRLVRFLGRDPWTSMPLIEKPVGQLMKDFLNKHHETMYTDAANSSRRVSDAYLPLLYQWALQMLSGLALFHSHAIVYVNPEDDLCWLAQDDLSLSFIGFIGAHLRTSSGPLEDDPRRWTLRNNVLEDIELWEYRGHANYTFDLITVEDPSPRTDLFTWACFMYRLMTAGVSTFRTWPREGEEPGPVLPGDTYYRGRGGGYTEAQMRRFLDLGLPENLESRYLGPLLDKCVAREYRNAPEALEDLRAMLRELGWETEGEATLVGFDGAQWLREHGI